MEKLMELADEIREAFKRKNKGKILEVLVEKSSGTTWSGWTQNYLEADESNFEIISGIPKKNEIIIGKLK